MTMLPLGDWRVPHQGPSRRQQRYIVRTSYRLEFADLPPSSVSISSGDQRGCFPAHLCRRAAVVLRHLMRASEASPRYRLRVAGSRLTDGAAAQSRGSGVQMAGTASVAPYSPQQRSGYGAYPPVGPGSIPVRSHKSKYSVVAAAMAAIAADGSRMTCMRVCGGWDGLGGGTRL